MAVGLDSVKRWAPVTAVVVNEGCFMFAAKATKIVTLPLPPSLLVQLREF